MDGDPQLQAALGQLAEHRFFDQPASEHVSRMIRIVRRHQAAPANCTTCNKPWPCDTWNIALTGRRS